MAEEAAEPTGKGPFLLVAVSAVVVIAVLVAVLVISGTNDSPPPPRHLHAEARAVATAWLKGWTADDRPALRRLLAHRAPDLAGVLDGFAAGLHPERITATAGAATVLGDRATVPFTADVTLTGVGTW